MSWKRVAQSFQALIAHALLFSFTLILSLKLDHLLPYTWTWWVVFSPLWLFHAVVARCRFSMPAPSMPHGRQWAPSHSVVATPLLVAFELLLCMHLGSSYAVNLKIVFLPLIVFEVVVLIDNIRMCRTLMPGDDENLTDEAVWETLPHFWVSIAMVFFIAGTTFTLLKICGDVAALGWWDLFINFGIAQCFAFLVCTKWHNPTIHGNNIITEPCSSSSSTVRYTEWSSRGFLVSSDEDRQQNGCCNLQDIGGHFMKIPIICFQLLLFMHIAGTPSDAKYMQHRIIFSPLLLLQGAGVLFAAYRLIEKIVLLLYNGDVSRTYTSIASKSLDCFGFFRHGSRLLGWWSIDERSREEEARLYCAGSSGYDTFSPDTVKKMPRADLVDEIWRLQAALSEQTEVTEYSAEAYERLQNEKILCRVCFEEQINVVLLPCRHHIICSSCSEKCKRCPVCRVVIEEPLLVYDM
ncbi:hypothetical protein Lal_00047777 [Lupinus albus]|uniref:Putative transcription factor C2H2 family n=1 Tax=Lupinus albus TaxID=3870 RepID=A0A6A4R0R5_LUPAL|nr:putative transcription factor C2H2 family [Lupinus albus]KAF1879105.1 hypothetical protein Lal_00047777 [Lupinus albus]